MTTSELRASAPEVHFQTAIQVPHDRVESVLDRVSAQLLLKATEGPDLSPLARRTSEYLGTEVEFKALTARLDKALRLGKARGGYEAVIDRATSNSGTYVGASNPAIVLARAKAVIALNAYYTGPAPEAGGPAF